MPHGNTLIRQAACAAAPARVRRAVGGHGAGQRRQLHARRGQLLAGDRPVGQPDRRGADPDRRHAAHLPARHTGRRAVRHPDRRRFLIFVQLLLASVSGTLLLLSHTGALTVDYLIALTFVGGIGAALMGPTWQSIVPELVPRADLKGRGRAQFAGHQYRPRHRPGRRRPDPGQFRRGRDLRHGRAQLCVRDRRPVVVEAPRRRRQHAVGELPGRVPRRPALYAGQQGAAPRAAARRRVLPVRQRRVGLAAAGGAPDAGRILGLLRRAAGRGGRGAILARCCCRAWASWTRTAWCCWRPWPARP